MRRGAAVGIPPAFVYSRRSNRSNAPRKTPIGLAGGLNLYGYAGGDPVNFSDPFGLTPCLAGPIAMQICAAAITTVGGAIGGGLGQARGNYRSGRDISAGVGVAMLEGARDGAAMALGGAVMGKIAGMAGRSPTVLGPGAPMTSTGELVATHGQTLSRAQMSKLQSDIAKNGVQESIKYVEHNGVKYVVDGHHRLQAATNLRIPNVPTQRVTLPYGGYSTVNDLRWSRY